MQVPDSWRPTLGEELTKPYFVELCRFVEAERAAQAVYPPPDLVFDSLRRTSPETVKVVILGQDPYHDEGQAQGLAFSVPPGVKPPPSLVNIFKELQADLQVPPPPHGCLTSWSEQGVLLLNTVLTVRAHKPNSHRKRGWEIFTDALLTKLSARARRMIFVLWGAPARKKKKLLVGGKHALLESAHPSPLSAHQGFFGSRPFSAINRTLASWGMAEIDWRVRG